MSEQPQQGQATQVPAFDSIRQVSPYDQEFWTARELMPLLGYQRWENFEVAIKRAKTSCAQTGNSVDDHFRDSTKIVSLGAKASRQVKDYILSRLACFLIAQNGDPEKPEIAAAQVYFAVATRTNELRELADKENQRVGLRERIIEGNKSLNNAAYSAGVLPRSFGKFHNAGIESLYGGLSLSQIKERKHIGDKEDLLDRAGLAELGANALRIGTTETELREGKVIGEANAIKTHREVGARVRKAIGEVTNRMPEDLPPEPSVKPLLDAKKRKQKKSVQPKEQGNLFEEREADNH